MEARREGGVTRRKRPPNVWTKKSRRKGEKRKKDTADPDQGTEGGINNEVEADREEKEVRVMTEDLVLGREHLERKTEDQGLIVIPELDRKARPGADQGRKIGGDLAVKA